MREPPVVLSIAGSDCSSGAGIQADLKAFSYFGTHGLTAVTCVVAETPQKVVSMHPVPPEVLQDQVRILLESYPVKAIKTGMLYSEAHMMAVAAMLESVDIPIVVDPVMVATSGARLLQQVAVQAYFEHLLPLATLVTPNLSEASVMLQRKIATLDQMEQAAREIAEQYRISCLLKGGHLPEAEDRVDVLLHEAQSYQYRAPTVDVDCSHGTGCSLASAIAANMAKGKTLPESVQTAKDWVHVALQESFHFGSVNKGEAMHALNQLRLESLQ